MNNTMMNTAMVNIRTSAREAIKVSVSSIIDSIKDNGYIDRHDNTHHEAYDCMGISIDKRGTVGFLSNAEHFSINELRMKNGIVKLSQYSVGGQMQRNDVDTVEGWKKYNDSLIFASNHVTDVYLLDGTHLHIEEGKKEN